MKNVMENLEQGEVVYWAKEFAEDAMDSVERKAFTAICRTDILDSELVYEELERVCAFYPEYYCGYANLAEYMEYMLQLMPDADYFVITVFAKNVIGTWRNYHYTVNPVYKGSNRLRGALENTFDAVPEYSENTYISDFLEMLNLR